MRHRIELADNLVALAAILSSSVPLIYVDPPFNTGKRQQRTTTRMTATDDGERTGFAGRRYQTTHLGTKSYPDAFDDYLAFLESRLREAHRVLAPNGTLYVHLDPREVHYVKVLLDGIFGRASFLNEIVWVYDYGGRPRDRWPAKHDDILVYVKNPRDYVFNADDVDREPYMAPGLVTPEKAARGKLPSDCWWHTIVSPTGKEKTGYPTQKPLGVLKRIVTASSRPDDVVLDFFAGSGTTGAAALALGRRFHLIDNNPEALAVMARRFAEVADVEYVGYQPTNP
ncbi:MAG TPA: site-specific DNA-methyltransferase [Thermomicrobiales bacterium]|jgi:site-specific DNA-methyltransferase (adenine-specific)